jgi:endonuclease/exonuclease/phosphatase family metal-dependent hydrolase
LTTNVITAFFSSFGDRIRLPALQLSKITRYLYIKIYLLLTGIIISFFDHLATVFTSGMSPRTWSIKRFLPYSTPSFSTNINVPLMPDVLNWQNQPQDRYSVTLQFNVVSFNMLAPVYKRLSSLDINTGFRKRESSNMDLWRARALKTLQFMEDEVFGHAEIIGLQELWLDQPYLTIFERDFKANGYDLHLLQRTGSKLDAVALAVKHNVFETIASQNVHLCTMSDRVALLLWLRHRDSGKNLLVANTHLSFPHNALDRMNQMQQMQTLTNVMETFAQSNSISQAARMIMGDFNVEAQSPVCDHLRSSGYASAFEICPPENGVRRCDGIDVDHMSLMAMDDAVRFVSHRNHRSEELGVDHIFIRPPHYTHDENNNENISEDQQQLEKEESKHLILRTEEERTRCTGQKPFSIKEGVFIDNCYVLPRSLAAGIWDYDFSISDHRPVGAKFIFAKPKEAEEGRGRGDE